MLTKEEVRKNLIESCRIFHFGSLSLTNEPAKSATKMAVAYAKDAGKLISFDPNYREPLWESEEQAKLINVTLGSQGSLSYYRDRKVCGKPFLSDRTIDTTGAGDTFCAGVLGFVLEHGLDYLEETDLEEMLVFENAAASIVTTRKGALRSMPHREVVQRLILRS